MKKHLVMAVWGLAGTLVFSGPARAEWAGPKEVLAVEWGSAPGQIGLFEDKLTGEDSFPRFFDIDSRGRILIDDAKNKRVQLFSENGRLVKVIKPAGKTNSLTSEHNPRFIAGDKIFLRCAEYYQLFDFLGTFLKQFYGPVHAEEVHTLPDGSLLVLNSDNRKFYQFSSQGELLNSYTARPLELGIWKTERIHRGKDKYKYRISVGYDNNVTYSLISLFKFLEYSRAGGAVYGLSRERVCRFDRDGESGDCLLLPEDKFSQSKRVLPQENLEATIVVLEEYGQPLVGPGGNVYIAKRTPTQYKIVKWDWEGGTP